jgi:iron complex transport system substrate-binding protein
MKRAAHILFFLLLCLAGGCRESAVVSTPKDSPRVVSLAPNLTEIVCALGARETLVGRTTACNYPESVRTVPVVADFGKPSLDALLLQQPTLVLEVDLMDKSYRQTIDNLGITRVNVPCRTLDDIPAAILTVGGLVDRSDEAEDLAGDICERLSELRAKRAKATNCPSVFVELSADALMTVGRNTFIAEMIELAGGSNIGSNVETDYYGISPGYHRLPLHVG